MRGSQGSGNAIRRCDVADVGAVSLRSPANPQIGRLLMTFVRKCEKCGSLDTRTSWSSPDEAAKDDAFTGWTCPVCAWTEFDLVEAEKEPAKA